MAEALTDTIPARLADQLARCIRCGLCLPACPTYDVFRSEMDAPRGRLMLMRAVWEDPAAARGAATEHLDLCLGCLACETACPSGVEYGSLLHETRAKLEAGRPGWGFGRRARRLLLGLLGRRTLLHALSRVISIKQGLGLIALGRRLPLPGLFGRAARLLPKKVTRFRPPGPIAPARGATRGRVALFRGCVQDAFLGRVNAATVSLLQEHGYEVHFPADQTCCGAAAHHVGEIGQARDLARRNLAAFDPSRFDAIVSNAGGCGAMLERYHELFEPDSEERVRAARFSDKVSDVSELLAAAPPLEASRPHPCRAVYADSCHLRHGQGVVAPPRELLRRVADLELVELRRPDHCCGSAGVYNLTQAETADRLLEAKLGEIAATGAGVVVTTNPGCQLQLAEGARRAGLDVEVVHLVELLERSHAAAD